MKRALLVDFDGVLRVFPASRQIEEQTGLPPGALARAAFDPELIVPAITGLVTDESWRAELVRALLARHPEAAAEEAVRRWSEPRGTLDPVALRLVQQARQSARVVLVTNATTRLPSDLERLGLAQAFDLVINSSAIGVAKPDARFFLVALERAAVAPAQAFFVDDALPNVSAASALGIQARHFTDVAVLEQVVRELELP